MSPYIFILIILFNAFAIRPQITPFFSVSNRAFSLFFLILFSPQAPSKYIEDLRVLVTCGIILLVYS